MSEVAVCSGYQMGTDSHQQLYSNRPLELANEQGGDKWVIECMQVCVFSWKQNISVNGGAVAEKFITSLHEALCGKRCSLHVLRSTLWEWWMQIMEGMTHFERQNKACSFLRRPTPWWYYRLGVYLLAFCTDQLSVFIENNAVALYSGLGSLRLR